MLKQNLGWVAEKTEPMESLENWINGKFASQDSKCRKVTTNKCPPINVLHIGKEPRKGEGDSRTNGKFGKLNQWKICIFGFLRAERSWHINVLALKWKLGWVMGKLNQRKVQNTESMENLYLWILRAERSPRINVLNIEMEPRKGEGDNQTNGKFKKLNQWKICISGFLHAERSPHINV